MEKNNKKKWKKPNVSISLYYDNIKKAEKIKTILVEAYQFEEGNNPNCLWFVKGKNCSVFYYKTHKLLFQGKEASYYFNLVESEDTITVNNQKLDFPIVGTDEAGKGDYFGPLVTAAVLIDKTSIKKLQSLSINDSKKLDSYKIGHLSMAIKKVAKYSIIVLNNQKYNEVYNKIKNMNKVLSYSHYLSIVNLFKKTKFENVIVDKFGKEEHLLWLLRNNKFNVIQIPKAEKYVPVAAASILARDRYIFELKKLNLEYNFDFKPGASNEVKELVNEFKRKYNKDDVDKVLKKNFKI
jgi:ribonuclease HIII